MALDTTNTFYGPMTIDFIYSSGPTTHLSYTGIKADVVTTSFAKKKDVNELADGSELEDMKGWTGTIEMELEELDATDIGLLQTYKPGATSGIDNVKITFTSRGSGSNYTLTFSSLSYIDVGIVSGKAWKTKITVGITGAADDELTDLVTIAHA